MFTNELQTENVVSKGENGLDYKIVKDSDIAFSVNDAITFPEDCDDDLTEKKDRYYKAIAKNGDGVYSLLRRFQLLNAPCNLERFYALNKLGKNANLVKGKVIFYQYYYMNTIERAFGPPLA